MKKRLTVAFLLIFLFATLSVKADKISNDANIQADVKIETNDGFIFQGEITRDSASSFEIMEETIAIPQDLLVSLDGKDVIEAGNTIRVGGIIRNRIRIAQEVKLISLTQGQRNTGNSKRLTNTIKVFFSNLQNKF